VATFHCKDAPGFLAELGQFWLAVRDIMPSACTITVANEGDIFDHATGVISGAWISGAPTVLPGLVAGSYAAPVGAVVNWQTGVVLGGRRLRGRTFIVPLGGGQFAVDGSLAEGPRNILRDAAAALVTASAGNMIVWRRNRVAKAATATRPAVEERGGAEGDVIGSRVPDLAAVLRSRRD